MRLKLKNNLGLTSSAGITSQSSAAGTYFKQLVNFFLSSSTPPQAIRLDWNEAEAIFVLDSKYCFLNLHHTSEMKIYGYLAWKPGW